MKSSPHQQESHYRNREAVRRPPGNKSTIRLPINKILTVDSALVNRVVGQRAEKLRGKDPARAGALDKWLEELRNMFSDQIIDIDEDIAREWGRLNGLRTVPVVDSLMAATARVHSLCFVILNARDIAGLGLETFDPFQTTAS